MWELQASLGGRPPRMQPAAARTAAEADPRRLWLRLRDRDVTPEEASEVFRALRQQGLVTQPKELSIAVNACGRLKLWTEALQWLRDMPQLGLEPNVFVYSAAIGACQKGKMSAPALSLLGDMRLLRLAPDQITYCTAMRACSHPDLWDKALTFLEEMQKTKLELNTILCNAAISACCAADKWKHALSLVETMWAGAVEVDTITFSTTISACERSSMWEQALRLLAVMEGLRIETDIVTCTAAISACVTGEAWQAALSLFHQMQEEGPRPNTVTFGAALDVCQKTARWEWSLGLLEAMQRQSLELNVVTCSAAIGACAACLHWERALDVFEGMLRQGLRPNGYTYFAAISACYLKWEAALGLLSRGLEQDKRVIKRFLPNTYRNVISACARAARFDLALGLIPELERYLSQADVNLRVTTYIAALRAVERSEQVGESIHALLGSFHGRVELDEVAYSTVISACSERGLWAQMLGLMESVLTQRLRPNRDIYMVAVMESEQRSSANLDFLFDNSEVSLAPVPGSPSDDMATKATLRLLHDLHGLDLALVMAKGLHCARVGQPLPGSELRPLSRLDIRAPYAKELRILHRVLTSGVPGEPNSVLTQVEDLIIEASHSSETLSEVAGMRESEVLIASMRGAPLHRPVLEIGTFFGYSTLQMAVALPGVQIMTLEVDPVRAAVARGVIGFAGLADHLEVLTGPSEQLLPRLAEAARRFGTVFMDRSGSQYDDLVLLEGDQGLLAPGAVLVANGVRRAPLLLWRVAADGPFTSHLACVREFALEQDPEENPEAEEAWLSVAVYLGPAGPAPAPLAAELRAPAELVRLHWRAVRTDELGQEAAAGEQEAFAEEMQRRLSSLGIAVTCTVE